MSFLDAYRLEKTIIRLSAMCSTQGHNIQVIVASIIHYHSGHYRYSNCKCKDRILDVFFLFLSLTLNSLFDFCRVCDAQSARW